MLNICNQKTAHKLSRMNFQDQFVAVNVENILPIVFRKDTISENETSRKVMLKVLKVQALLPVQVTTYCSCMHQIAKQKFSGKFNRKKN